METQSEVLNAALPHGPVHGSSPRSALNPMGSWPWLPVRQLHVRHRPRVLDHLLALSDSDRQLRFGHVVSDYLLGQYVEQLDFDGDDIFGVFDSQLQLVAMAHLAFDESTQLAEFGVSVQAHLRGRGIGATLFERAVTQARNRGAQSMAIHLERNNAAMLAIVRRAGAEIEFDGAQATAQLELPARTLGTHVEALVDRHAANIDYRIKMQVLRLDRLWPGQRRAEVQEQEQEQVRSANAADDTTPASN
jgi:GNAT superfamily N-acetyltransferase